MNDLDYLQRLKDQIAELIADVAPDKLATLVRLLASDDLEVLRLGLAEISQLVERETLRREMVNAPRQHQQN